MKYFVILLLVICVNSFKNRFFIKKNKLNVFYDHHEYDEARLTYTIMGSGNKETIILLKDIEDHRINHYYINITYYSHDDVVELCKKYNIEHNSDVYEKPLVFTESNKFIGSSFELYQDIIKY
jgi:hypothetical protein